VKYNVFIVRKHKTARKSSANSPIFQTAKIVVILYFGHKKGGELFQKLSAIFIIVGLCQARPENSTINLFNCKEQGRLSSEKRPYSLFRYGLRF
jgi:hypothetical protein